MVEGVAAAPAGEVLAVEEGHKGFGRVQLFGRARGRNPERRRSGECGQ